MPIMPINQPESKVWDTLGNQYPKAKPILQVIGIAFIVAGTLKGAGKKKGSKDGSDSIIDKGRVIY